MIKIFTAVFIALIMILPVQASPPINTINNPRIILHKSKAKVEIKWFQYVQTSSKLIIAFKVTNNRQSGSSICADVDWAEYITRTEGFKYCYDILNKILDKNQWITAIDKNWHKEDRYYIIQYDFTSHNAPYGPFVAK